MGGRRRRWVIGGGEGGGGEEECLRCRLGAVSAGTKDFALMVNS
jgi:hypothetical protein